MFLFLSILLLSLFISRAFFNRDFNVSIFLSFQFPLFLLFTKRPTYQATQAYMYDDEARNQPVNT